MLASKYVAGLKHTGTRLMYEQLILKFKSIIHPHSDWYKLRYQYLFFPFFFPKVHDPHFFSLTTRKNANFSYSAVKSMIQETKVLEFTCLGSPFTLAYVYNHEVSLNNFSIKDSLVT